MDVIETSVTDAGLAHVEGLTELRKLDLSGSNLTDDAIEHFKGLGNLEYLSLGVPK